MFYLSLQFFFSFFSWTKKAYTASLIIQWSTDFYYVYSFLGGDAMFGDAEHYKYLTNEADLNNANDDCYNAQNSKESRALFLLLVYFVCN